MVLIVFIIVVFVFDIPKVNTFIVIGFVTAIIILLYEFFGYKNTKE